MSPHRVTRDFEAAIAAYCGSRFAVATSSCTAALQLACMWHIRRTEQPDARTRPVFEIPRRTYVGVGMAILNAGGRVAFRDEDWVGMYQLKPYPIWDSARWLTSGIYGYAEVGDGGQHICLSFHWTKTLGVQQGGCILHDSPEADDFYRRARFDGRREGVDPVDDTFDIQGMHCYMSPEVAALGLMRLSFLPKYNAPLPNSNYSDLSLAPIFKDRP